MALHRGTGMMVHESGGDMSPRSVLGTVARGSSVPA